MPECPLTSVLTSEILGLGEAGGKLYFILKNAQKKLTEEEFYACLDANMLVEPRIVFSTVNEYVKPAKTPPKKPIQKFFSEYTKPEYKLNYTPVVYQAPKEMSKPPQLDTPSNISDIFVGGAAITALLLSTIQQAKKKKEQLEQQKCCSESKLSISSLQTDVNKLKLDLEAKTQESSKAIHAEMYEQYKEIKEMREDADNIKDIIAKLINK
jgi:hypothetical protein